MIEVLTNVRARVVAIILFEVVVSDGRTDEAIDAPADVILDDFVSGSMLGIIVDMLDIVFVPTDSTRSTPKS